MPAKPLSSDGFGRLVGVVSVFVLQLVDQRDVFLLGLAGVDTFVDNLLPGLLFGFALLQRSVS